MIGLDLESAVSSIKPLSKPPIARPAKKLAKKVDALTEDDGARTNIRGLCVESDEPSSLRLANNDQTEK